MFKIIYKTSVLTLIMMLAGCQQRDDNALYSHLLQHPLELKQELQNCQSDRTSDHCKIVEKAADKIMTLREEQRRNPEEFGMRILRAEMQESHEPSTANKEQVDAMLGVVGLSSPE